MRVVLRLLGTRYGIALILLLLTLGVVATFRGVAGTRHPERVAPPLEPSRTVSVEPGGGDDGLAVPARSGSSRSGQPDDDDADTAAPSLAPSATTEATTVAGNFAAAWVRHTGVSAEQWYAGMAPFATQALMAKLKGADPTKVPADRTAGSPSLLIRDTALIEAGVPLDSGRLRLRLVVNAGHWKVDGVDWERPR